MRVRLQINECEKLDIVKVNLTTHLINVECSVVTDLENISVGLYLLSCSCKKETDRKKERMVKV